MLDGIMSDNRIKLDEIVHLATWLRNSEDALDPTLAPLLELIDDIICDGQIDDQEEQMLKETIDQLRLDLVGERRAFDFEESLIQHIVGVIKGATADQELNDAELKRIYELLNTDVGLQSNFAASIKSSIKRCGKDKKLLVQTLCAIAGHDPSSGIVSGQAIGGIFDDPDNLDDIKFSGKRFSFTGTFKYGTRKACVERIEKLGASFTKTLA